MKKIKSDILEFIFLPFVIIKYRKNPPEDYLNKLLYPQSWYFMPHNKLTKIIQFFCGILGGHEQSKTEWGYGGGEYADTWCRWCNKMFQVPKTSVYFTNPTSRELMKMVGTVEKEK